MSGFLDEYKLVLCGHCGSPRRIVLRWDEHRAHRFKATKVATAHKEAWICLGCDLQVDMDGQPVTEQQEGWLHADEIKKLRRTS